ncbi:MAG: hypothetical protein IPK03_10610 [Bacteroidetes bacterium]|nr:hypothetical protein [Bacteroidota bacterium]
MLNKSKRIYSYHLITLVGFSLLCSCNVTKLLQDNETILKQNKIIVQSDDDAVNKWFIKDELKTHSSAKANKRTLFIFPLNSGYMQHQRISEKTNLDGG